MNVTKISEEKNRCLFNHELLIVATTCSPYQSYDEDITDAQVIGYIEELQDTDVDTIMCCPTAWRRNLWYSEVDRHWQDEAPGLAEPTCEHDYKYYEKAYYRMRRYMLQGKDPVGLSLQAAHDIGRDFFISYRMNDHHYLEFPDNPCHNTFWRSHPEYHFTPWNSTLGNNQGFLNYALPEVRAYYFAILEEITTRYDIDGLELDFMRSPAFFPNPADGLAIMTDFVRQIRALLDRLSVERHKTMPLCVRLPQRYAECAAVGLDVARWAREGLIDMVNISSFYINDLDLEIGEYRRYLPDVRLYGEMHFIVDSGELPGGYKNNVTRKTSREMYLAMAEHYLAQGADGLSLFNFDYVRHHHFREPRRKMIPDIEPPFDVLRGIIDRDRLARSDKHFYWRSAVLDVSHPGTAAIRIWLTEQAADYHQAILRVTSRESYAAQTVEAFWNDQQLPETIWCGELFPPLTVEALLPIQQMRFFRLDPIKIKPGNNLLELRAAKGAMPLLQSVDLALYIHEPFAIKVK